MRSYLSEDDDDDSDDNNKATSGSSNKKFRNWLEWKQDGKRAYERGDYGRALESYRSALQPEYECPTKADQAVLWSNVVACRLQLVDNNNHNNNGRPTKDLAMARAAVHDAKTCVELHPNWAKGHLRLASAYIALGGHSNDACNELQTVLRIDPGNSNARQLLIRELRRDHREAADAAAERSSSSSQQQQGQQQQEQQQEQQGRDPPHNPRYVPPSASSTHSSSAHPYNARPNASQGSSSSSNNNNINAETYIDDGLTWKERLAYYWARAVESYQNLPTDVKTAIKVSAVLLVLYVAFGGRFGLGSSTPSRSYDTGRNTDSGTTRGNYGSSNAYEEYYRQKQQQSYRQAGGGAYRDTTKNHDYHHQRRTSSYDDDYYGTSSQHNSNNNNNSRRGFRMSDLFDGSVPSMLILAGLGYVAHRNGINPFQAIMMLNLMAGGRRRYGGGYGGGRFRYRERRRRGGFGW